MKPFDNYYHLCNTATFGNTHFVVRAHFSYILFLYYTLHLIPTFSFHAGLEHSLWRW